MAINKNVVANFGFLTVGVLVGSVTANIVTKKLMRAQLEKEIVDVKAHYRGLLTKAEATPSELAAIKESGIEIVEEGSDEHLSLLERQHATQTGTERERIDYTARSAHYRDGEVETVEEETVTVRAFEESDAVEMEMGPHALLESDEDQVIADLKSKRTKDRPYLITAEEFFDQSDTYADWTRVVLHYYPEDNSLCDERETLVPNHEATVGQEHLHMFGIGTNGDPDTVYVRNEEREVIYEIQLEEGEYTAFIMGGRKSKKIKSKTPRMPRED